MSFAVICLLVVGSKARSLPWCTACRISFGIAVPMADVKAGLFLGSDLTTHSQSEIFNTVVSWRTRTLLFCAWQHHAATARVSVMTYFFTEKGFKRFIYKVTKIWRKQGSVRSRKAEAGSQESIVDSPRPIVRNWPMQNLLN